jgi:hypothetical protein
VRAEPSERSGEIKIPRTAALGALERMYRAVAPAGYRERLE